MAGFKKNTWAAAAIAALLGTAGMAAARPVDAAAAAPGRNLLAAGTTDAALELTHLEGPDYPATPAKGGDQAAATRAAGAKQSCYRLGYDGYCNRGYQQNCCAYETRTSYGGCSVSDGGYNCGRGAPIMVCCR